ncbi:carbohydrate kinase family protein [Thalassospira sp.]|uniref:carbohydrate kinase family protein n=1 Tax=Thalassospira sp. TaxID=1912094 RepID=UPI002736E03C|nr:carbohydrate kinase family protein [Thalassospira sp.]MDP2698040.1 carbohydrate kinase family protein [Thalassospira sp.]
MTLSTRILCLGAAHFDRTLQCTERFVPAASNPVRTLHRKPGGVSRNIAVHLRLLGCHVGMISAVGDDGDGDQILQSLTEIGIDTRQISKISQGHTAGYSAILDQDGELALGLMDAEIYETLTPEFLAGKRAGMRNWGWWLTDANLPPESLAWLAQEKGDIPLCAATVSPSKAVRWKPLIGQIDLLIANRIETEILTGQAVNTPSDARQAIEKLRTNGTGKVIVTLGAQGIVAGDGDGIFFWPPLPTKVRDVNGAGDAFFAGFMAAFTNPQNGFDAAVAQGLALASLTAETEGTTVWNLDVKQVQNRASNAVKTTI